MRTTINLDDEVLAAAKAKSRMSGQNLGRVLSEWARAGMEKRPAATPARNARGRLPAFDVAPDAPLIPADKAGKMLDDDA